MERDAKYRGFAFAEASGLPVVARRSSASLPARDHDVRRTCQR
jgi:hypothetical protein